MATLATRLTNTGTYLVNGTFDEVTQTKVSVTTDTVYASSFDEVTYSTLSTILNGGRYNLVNYSNYYAVSGGLGWDNIFPAGATVTTGIDAPDNSSTAVRFTGNNTTNALLRCWFTGFTPNGTDTYTVSFWVRKVSGTTAAGNQLTSDLHDGLGGNYLPSLVTGQWIRYSYSGVPTASSKTFLDLLSDRTTDYVLDFWGVQIEKSSSATIYQPVYNGIVAPTMIHRADASSNVYITGIFDEVSGIT